MTRMHCQNPRAVTTRKSRRLAKTSCIRLVGPACCMALAVLSASTAWSQADPNTPSTPAPSGELARRLWETRISLPESNEDAEAKDDLQSLIQKVRSLQFEDNEVTPTFSSSEQSRPSVEPNQTSVRPPRPAPRAVPRATAATNPEIAPPGSLRPATLDQLAQVAQAPEHVSNPLEVAELLFLSGYPTEAIPFYESALAKTSRTDETTNSDRAWILFQLANCLRDTDMTRARDTYQKLVAEHSDSPWAELARVQGRLITWYLTTKPDQLLTEP